MKHNGVRINYQELMSRRQHYNNLIANLLSIYYQLLRQDELLDFLNDCLYIYQVKFFIFNLKVKLATQEFKLILHDKSVIKCSFSNQI